MKLLSKITVLIVLIALYSCNPKEGENEDKVSTNVKTQKIVPSKGYTQYSYSGQIISDQKSTLSFLVGGMIQKMHVTEGQSVRKGELLATLNATDYQNDLLLRQASLLEAKDRYERMMGLYEKNSIPESDYIRSKAAYLSADALVKIARKKVSDTKLYAPFDGIIYRKIQRKGTIVQQGHPVYEIANLANLDIVFSVPENEINTLHIGDEVNATVTSLNNVKVKAKISSIVTVADAITRSYQVKAVINNEEGILKDGMLVTINVKTLQEETQIMVPGNAIVMSSRNVPHVFVFNSTDNRAFKKRIKVGNVHGTAVQVIQGLQGNEIIVTEGHHNLRDGNLVNNVADNNNTVDNNVGFTTQNDFK